MINDSYTAFIHCHIALDGTFKHPQKDVNILAMKGATLKTPASKETNETNETTCPKFITNYIENNFLRQNSDVSSSYTASEIISAQQKVFILTPSNGKASKKNKLVARIWNGSARWWNLNSLFFESFFSDDQQGSQQKSHTEIISLARAEVTAYRLVKEMLQPQETKAENDILKVVLPEVLYFSHDFEDDKDTFKPCWGLFSYVGKGSIYFSQRENIFYNDLFTKSMIKVRHEFGFDEPHPRHGRVIEPLSLPYALKLLDQFVLPLHVRFILSHRKQTKCNLNNLSPRFTSQFQESNVINSNKNPWTYSHMLEMYEYAAKVFQQLFEALLPDPPNLNNTPISNKSSQLPKSTSNSNEIQKVIQIIHVWLQCVKQLRKESFQNGKPAIRMLPPVLCHLDLQPQNIMFYNDKENTSSMEIPNIRCVLDWEEAAFADPRFELLLIGRKVCANLSQAEIVWEYYNNSMQSLLKSMGLEDESFELGKIYPWLKLEAVHSLLTMILQMGIHVDTLHSQSGRGEMWETSTDLLNKINREFLRLASLGWTFCRGCNDIKLNKIEFQ